MIRLNNNLQHSAEITSYVIKNYFLLYIYLILYKKFPTKLFSVANKTLNLTLNLTSLDKNQLLCRNDL